MTNDNLKPQGITPALRKVLDKFPDGEAPYFQLKLMIERCDIDNLDGDDAEVMEYVLLGECDTIDQALKRFYVIADMVSEMPPRAEVRAQEAVADNRLNEALACLEEAESVAAAKGRPGTYSAAIAVLKEMGAKAAPEWQEKIKAAAVKNIKGQESFKTGDPVQLHVIIGGKPDGLLYEVVGFKDDEVCIRRNYDNAIFLCDPRALSPRPPSLNKTEKNDPEIQPDQAVKAPAPTC